ncbi:GRX_SH3BGR domain-containing protein [Anabas testudineus]|uniref:SH3 domain-binding glutamic acid-rich-like protein n=1 Tax=Anabas testudineus TaxID=64144 RepID=A0A7N6AJL8_ANATE|nr:GRX_SH3BGR domain-containing protein [Anabas testudineus]
MTLTVYITSVSSSVKIKKDQERIISVLQSKKISFKPVDISQNPADKDTMRKIAGNPTALPPIICSEGVYCGDITAFENAIEEDKLYQFLKL